MDKILVMGFYGVVKDLDLSNVFGDSAFRLDYKKLRINTFGDQWSFPEYHLGYMDLSKEDIEELHLLFYKAMSRLPVYDKYDLCSIDNRFYQLIYYSYNILTSSPVDIVLFSEPPHAPLESLIYGLAKKLKIKIIVCMQSIFPGGFYAMPYIGTSETYYRASIQYKMPSEVYQYDDSALDLFYMRGIKSQIKGIYKMVFSNLTRAFHWRKLRRARHGRSLRSILNEVALYREWKRAKKISKLKVDELPDKYIYVPLHLQPEATTSAIGGVFYHQIQMIHQLRSLIPDDICIAIKENPKQGLHGRGLGFYEMLDKIDGVKWVEERASSQDVIKKALATATITGTAGWESLRSKKPVIYFGNPWYARIYGAFRAKENVFEEISHFNPDQSRFEASIDSLTYVMQDGYVANSYMKGNNQVTYNDNLNCLKKSFSHLIKAASKVL